MKSMMGKREVRQVMGISYLKVAKIVDLKSSHHKYIYIYVIYSFIYICDCMVADKYIYICIYINNCMVVDCLDVLL